jgi:hypothetical protein
MRFFRRSSWPAGATALLAVAACLAGFAPSAQALSLCLGNVTQINPAAPAFLPFENLLGVTTFNGNYYIVGTGGTVLVSPNTTVWTQESFPSTLDLHSVAASPSTLVTVGGNIYLTTNGKSWSAASAVLSGNLNSVIWTGTRFVGAGDGGEVADSDTGLSWTVTTNTGTSNNMDDIILTGNQVVAVGEGGTILLSPDGGLNWVTESSFTTENLHSIAYNGSVAVAVGDNNFAIISSDNGTTWSTIHTIPILPSPTGSNNLHFVRWLDDRFVVGGDYGYIVESPDGQTWSVPTPTTAVLTLRNAALGLNGLSAVVVGENNEILTTPDRATFTQYYTGVYCSAQPFANPSQGEILNGPAAVGSAFSSITDNSTTIVEAGPGGSSAASSDGGTFWTQSLLPIIVEENNTGKITAYFREAMSGVTYATTWNQYVGVGSLYTYFTSPDGINWTGPTVQLNTNPALSAVAWDDIANICVAVGDSGNIAAIEDSGGLIGTSITAIGQGVTTDNLNNLFVSGNHVMAVGASGESIRSSDVNINDGGNWTGEVIGNIEYNSTGVPVSTVTTGANMTSVGFGNGLWLAVGENDTAFTAQDDDPNFGPGLLLSWNPVVVPTFAAGTTLTSVSFSGTFWVVTGADGDIYLSLDTITWLPCTGPNSGTGLNQSLQTSTDFVFIDSNDNTFTGTFPTVIPPVTITSQPKSTETLLGKTTKFTVVGNAGGYPVFYQWYFNGKPLSNGGAISGARSSTLVINPTQSTAAGKYYCIVSNGLKAVQSNTVTLTIYFPPVITVQPVSQLVLAHQMILLTVTVTGTPPFHYQWYFKGKAMVNGGVVEGVTSRNLIITYANQNRAGGYKVSITNYFNGVPNTIFSKTATIRVSTP